MRDRVDGKKASINTDEFEAALADNLRALESARPKANNGRRSSLVCLGESHGSHLFALKRRVLPGTGGLLLRMRGKRGSDIILDPGWGTLAAAHRLGVSLGNIRMILISHCHLDHVGDLQPLLITLALQGQRPILVANSTSIKGGPGQPSILPEYFRKLCEQVIVARASATISTESLHVTPFRTSHRENPRVVGRSVSYIITSPVERLNLGLLTDGPLGNLSEATIEKLRKCQVLVLNIGTISTRPDSPSHSRIFDNALCLHGFQNFIERLYLKQNVVRKIAVTHLGAELLETQSSLMRKFLNRSGHDHPVELMTSAINEIVKTVSRKEVAVRVLREGDTLEV